MYLAIDLVYYYLLHVLINMLSALDKQYYKPCILLPYNFE
jgi:hypothetical protein